MIIAVQLHEWTIHDDPSARTTDDPALTIVFDTGKPIDPSDAEPRRRWSKCIGEEELRSLVAVAESWLKLREVRS